MKIAIALRTCTSVYSYWYDSVKLYRQRVWKDWSDPFLEVKNDLIKLLETA